MKGFRISSCWTFRCDKIDRSTFIPGYNSAKIQLALVPGKQDFFASAQSSVCFSWFHEIRSWQQILAVLSVAHSYKCKLSKRSLSGFSRASICSSCSSDSLRRFVNYLPKVYFADTQEACPQIGFLFGTNARSTYLKNQGKRLHTWDLLEPVRNFALFSPGT